MARTPAERSEANCNPTADTYSSKPSANYNSTGKDRPTKTAPLEPVAAPTSQAGSRCPAIQTSTDGSAPARHNSTLSSGNLTCTRDTCIRVCRMQYTYLPPKQS